MYYQLKTLLLDEILRGKYGADGRLPTEHELCALHGLSRTPVSHALAELAEEGVVLRHRRRGTFVNPHWFDRRSQDSPEVRVLVPRGGPWAEHLRSVAPPGSRLSFAVVDMNELHSAFVHAVAEGRAPDFAVVDSVWVAEFAASGFLYPLEELDPSWVAEDYDQDFLQPFVDAYRIGGATVAVQAQMDVGGLWYNRAHLERLDAAPPETWAELLRLGRRLRAANPRRHALVLPGGPAADEFATYCLATLLASNGAGVLGPDAVTLASPAAVAALRLLRRLVDEEIVPAQAVSFARERPIYLLGRGRASLAVGGSYDEPALADSAGIDVDQLPQRFGFIPMPAGPQAEPAVLVGGLAYCISRQAREAKRAMRLLTAAVSTRALIALCERTGHIPPRRSAVESVAPSSPFHAYTTALLDRGVLRPITPSYALVSAQLQTMVETVLDGRRTPNAAIARTADLVAAITGLPVRTDPTPAAL